MEGRRATGIGLSTAERSGECRAGALQPVNDYLGFRQVEAHPNVRISVSSGKQSRSSLPKLQDTVRLSADGLAKVLGDLEARVLRAVWAIDRPATAREVHERVIDEHAVSPLTTITVLNRLVGKRVLKRGKSGDRIHFAARLEEGDFMSHVSRRVVEGVLSFDADAVAASFVDVLAERDPEQLEVLARLIRKRLRERSGG